MYLEFNIFENNLYFEEFNFNKKSFFFYKGH
jgi:hypothetical protein